MRIRDLRVRRFYEGEKKNKLRQIVGWIRNVDTSATWLCVQRWYGKYAVTMMSVEDFLFWARRAVGRKKAARLISKVRA